MTEWVWVAWHVSIGLEEYRRLSSRERKTIRNQIQDFIAQGATKED